MKRRTITAVAGATALALGLALTGCSSQSSGSASGSDTVSSGPATGTITIWAQGDEGQKLGPILKDFEKQNPKVTIKLTPTDWNTAYQKYTSAIASGKGPDIGMIGTTWMAQFASTGGLQPVPKNYITSADYFTGPWQTVTVQGTAYGVPWNTSVNALYYRKDMAQKAGYTSVPQTWDGFRDFTKALQTKGGAKYGTYISPSGVNTWQALVPYGFTLGAKITDSKDQFTIDSAKWVQAMTYYQSFFKQGIADPNRLEANQDDYPALANGTIGSFLGGSNIMTSLEQLKGKAWVDQNIGLVPMPGASSSQPGVGFVGGSDMAVMKSSQNKDAAWKLMKYLGSTEVQAEWYKQDDSAPANIAAWKDGPDSDPTLKVYSEALKSSASTPNIPNWTQVSAVFDTDLEKLSTNTSTPKQIAQNIQQQAESIGTGL
jgi:multiple sugar transport system substrate-binding protein